MKIENNGGLPIAANTASRTVSHKHSPATDHAPVAEAALDSVETSAIAQQLEADPSRIEHLREAVRNGTYSVPAREVSARIITEHLKDNQ